MSSDSHSKEGIRNAWSVKLLRSRNGTPVKKPANKRFVIYFE